MAAAATATMHNSTGTTSERHSSSSPPDSSPETVVVPGLNVLLKGMDGQTRLVPGLSGDSTLRDLYNVSGAEQQRLLPFVSRASSPQ